MVGVKSKILTALVSLAIAFGLWLYVVTVVSPESEDTYYNIPVILQNESILAERGLMITSETPTVNLRLQGNRTDLIELNQGNITVLSNVYSIVAPGTHRLNYTVSYSGVPDNAITVLSGDPNLVELKIENKITKNVPVKIDYGDSKVPDGFIADKENVVLDYRVIQVSGPQSVVDKVKQAKIEVDLNQQDQTLIGTFDYALCDDEGEPVDVKMVTTNVEAVNLQLTIQRVKEIKLTVAVIDGGGATAASSSITILPEETIRVSGSDALLEGLDTLELGTINLAELQRDASLKFPIVLPEGITNQTGLTEATVQVRFPNLRTKRFSVTEINVINVPEGMEVDMITKALEVTVRGPIARVNAMNETDITVTVDFAGAQPGTATMKAEVTIGSNFSDVGAMGAYSVSATLQEAEETK